MNTRSLILYIVIVLAVTALLLSLGLALFTVGQHNRQKVEHLTSVCVEHGYGGWVDTNNSGGACLA